MTNEQQRWIKQLAKCTFLPGSWVKRFVRDLASLGTYDLLTEKQTLALERTAWHYRKQRGDRGMTRPASVPPEPRAVNISERAKLEAWNKGEKIK
jgi:hypothetical protein